MDDICFYYFGNLKMYVFRILLYKYVVSEQVFIIYKYLIVSDVDLFC